MFDPQDLLYTNNFISSDILTDTQLTQGNEYYERFKNYIDNTNNNNETDKYIDNDLDESSPINLNKGLNTKWPIYSNKNHHPMFDTYIKDISENKYKKNILTKINIDSSNRDISKFTYANKFSLPLNKVFNNVNKIIISDLIMPNVNQSITNINNNLAWQYTSTQYLISENIDLNILPVPDLNRQISYSSLPDATSFNDINQLVYQTSVNSGYYTISNLLQNIKLKTSQILHGTSNNIEQPYVTYDKLQRTPHLFSCFIDPISSVVRFVNRIEEIKIEAMQSFSPYETDFQNNDIFYYFSSNSNYILDTDYIYVIIPTFDYITTDINPFPFVITELNVPIGDLDNSLINYTEFYDINIYLNNGYTVDELNSISYYTFIDTLTFTSYVGSNLITKKYFRFGLKISTGNLNGNNYNKIGNIIKPISSNNTIFSNSLNNLLAKNGLIDYTFVNSISKIGRALLFRWIFDLKNNTYIPYEITTSNEKKISLLHILAWPIPNITFNLLTPKSPTNSFRFVHTNYQTDILSSELLPDVQYLKLNTIPSQSLNLQYISNDYYFIVNSYILLKLNFKSTDGIDETGADSQYINAASGHNLLYNQVYIDDYFFDVGIGEDYTVITSNAQIEVQKKYQTSIFAKVILSNTPGNYDTIISNVINNNSFYTFYNSFIDNLDTVSIEVYDSTLKLITMTTNFSFTLEIHEVKEVLKETLINTKANNINTTGHFI